MHELLVEVLPYLAAFYLLDGIALLSAHHLVFARSFGRTQLVGRGLQLLPFAPDGEAFASLATPVLVTATGIWTPKLDTTYVPRVFEPDDLRFVAFERLERVTIEGKKLLVDGERVLDAPSAAILTQLRADIEVLRNTSPEQRLEVYRRRLERATDLARFRARRLAIRPYLFLIRLLGWTTTLAMLSLLVVLELANDARFAGAMLPLVQSLGLLLLTNVFGGAAMLIRAGFGVGDATARATMMLLLPFSALRPLLTLSRDLYRDFHWSALAAELLARPDFLRLAREELWRIEQSARAAEGSEVAPAWQLARLPWENVLQQVGSPMEGVLADPATSDAQTALYCPLCSSEFRDGFETCLECGVALRSVVRHEDAQRRAG